MQGDARAGAKRWRRWLVAGAIAAMPARAEAHARAHVPEPMVFDLVRGLDPDAGELEANVLGRVPLSRETGPGTWAPEIEWAPTRGVAVELELPMQSVTLEAVKLAGQVTLPSRHPGRFLHGVQVATALHRTRAPTLHGLYVVQAAPTSRLGVVAMVGPRVSSPADEPSRLLVNGAVMGNLPRGHALGLELDTALGGRDLEVEAVPQLHLRLSSRVRVQLGVGVGGRFGPTSSLSAFASARVIVERRS